MGLDMYLSAKKVVSGGYDHYRYNYVREEGKPPRREPMVPKHKEAVKFDALLRTMGMGKFEDFKEKYPNGNSITVQIGVAYWRKANAIHQWFVDNVQVGKDECQESYVSREQLQALLDVVTIILGTASKGELTIEKDIFGNEWESFPNATLDVDLAKEALGTQAGFFFGSTAYDQWYILDLELTRDQLTQVLNDPELEGYDFYYQSSW